MTRARDVSRLVTTPPNIYATDTETSSAGYLTNDSASSTYLTQVSASTTYQGAPNRNLIINGAMQIAQRATSLSSITTSLYKTVDRWALSFAAAQNFGTWTQSVENDGPSNSEFSKSLKMLCTTAQASPASSAALIFYQAIEGQNLQGIKKGTSAAQPLTLSFWVKSNVVGTYVCSLLDENNSIGFPPYGTSIARTYTINAVNTWEKKVVTFSAGTSGVISNTNGVGLRLYHWLGAGSNYTSGTLNLQWASNTPGTEAVGQVNVASAINNYWQITGIQLEIGSTATPFEFKSFAQDLTECKRYYEKSYSQGVNPGTSTTASSVRFRAASSSVEIGLNFSITKRAAPTVTLYSTTGASGNIRDLSTSTNGAATGDTIGDSWFFATKTTGGTAGNSYAFHYVAEIEL
jgi:hypothetical protein